VSAAPAAGAEYTVVTCNGQSAATGGWTLFASGPNTALSEACGVSGGSMAAALAGNGAPAASNAGWQVSAPANTTVVGATLDRKVGVAGTGYGYVARGLTPAAANDASWPATRPGPTSATRRAFRSPRAPAAP
jgi:hypothetical protein